MLLWRTLMAFAAGGSFGLVIAVAADVQPFGKAAWMAFTTGVGMWALLVAFRKIDD